MRLVNAFSKLSKCRMNQHDDDQPHRKMMIYATYWNASGYRYARSRYNNAFFAFTDSICDGREVFEIIVAVQ